MTDKLPEITGVLCAVEGSDTAQINAHRSRRRIPRIPLPDSLRPEREVAAKFGCSVKTVRGHVKSGALRCVVIGHGAKRQRRMFTDADLDAFIANQTRKDVPACPSTGSRARRSGTSTSTAEVIGFSARRSARLAAKRKR
jgi:hypothetical protein